MNLRQVHSSMLQRCYNPNRPNFHDYGGRGIKVVGFFHNFAMFANWAWENGYGLNVEIDRRDNDGDYSAENCRFVSRGTNQRNRRKKLNATSKYLGVSLQKQKFRATIRVNGKVISLGCFYREIDAHKAYQSAKKKYYPNE